jgi:MFS family permease
VLVLASAANLMVGLDALVVSTALTEIGRELGASIETLEWTVNAYTLSFAAFLLTAAVLGDRFGRRRLFAAGLVLFVAASAACALASKASGTLGAIRQLGGAFGVALTVAVFARAGSHATPMTFSQGFAAANGVAAMLSLGAGAGLFLPGARGKARIAPSADPAILSSPGDKA